jgi:hypothetical protein
MSAINFPSSPIVGQTYSVSNKIWTYDGTKWKILQENNWVRNSMWLTLPDVTGMQKFAGLFGVYPDSNFVALAAAGNYTVDWGDGTATENVSTGVAAERNIAYTNASANSDVGIADAVAVTFTDSGDTVNRTAHNFLNNERVAFSTITSTTGISTYVIYYIVNAATNTFQVASTVGGSALTLTTDGSGGVYRPKYRQVIITVVPNGGNLTGLYLQRKHSMTGLQIYSCPWLDIVLSGTNLTSISIGGNTVQLQSLQQMSLIGANNIANFNNLFAACHSLASIPEINTTACTNFSAMFSYCYSLIFAPTLASASVTNFTSMFTNCHSLAYVPIYNTVAGTNFSSMFANCYSIVSVPLFNTTAGTNFSSMFSYCHSLIYIPLLNTAAGTNFASMFVSCEALINSPTFNTILGINFTSMFENCIRLLEAPALNTVAGVTFTSMFSSCQNLKKGPALNTSLGVLFTNMFATCTSLSFVPVYDTTAVTAFTTMFSNCRTLKSARFNGTSQDISYTGCELSGAALDDIYTGLASVAKTITVTNNWGNAYDTPSIATGKGWTVVG